MAKHDGLTDPKLGRRVIAEARLTRYELKIERAIKAVLAKHKTHALAALRAQHLTAAAPPDAFGLYSFDTNIEDMVAPEIGQVLGDLAQSTFNFLALPPEVRAKLLGQIDLSSRADDFAAKVRTIGSDVAARLTDELAIGVGKGESIDDLTKRITDVFDIADNIAERVVRTETHGAAEETTFASATAIADAGNEVTKSWLATADGRTRASHSDADGQTVGIDEPYIVGDEELMFPGDGSPENSVNCRCSQIFQMSGSNTDSVDNSDIPSEE